MVFYVLITAFQTVITAIRHGFESEEIGTPFEALLYRLVRIVVFDLKYILLTVILWGGAFRLSSAINTSWLTLTSSIAVIFSLVAAGFIFISGTIVEKSIIFDTGIFIYAALLTPRLLFKNLRPGNILHNLKEAS